MYLVSWMLSSATWLIRAEQPIHAGIAFGAFNVAKGISAVASSFISSAMYNQSMADNKQLYGSFGRSR